MAGGRRWTDAEIADLTRYVAEGKSYAEIGGLLDRHPGSCSNKAQFLRLVHPFTEGKRFRVESPPTANRSVDEVLAAKLEDFKRKRDHHEAKKQGIPVTIEGSGPFALVAFGDPHMDDDGFDLEAFMECVGVVNSDPDVFAFNLGDLTNNWVRALGHLYGVQHTLADEAHKLIDWMLGLTDWLWVILGNHDKWGTVASDACDHHGVCKVSHGAKFIVRRGGCEVVIDARHTHRGNSQYNPSHAQLKRNYRGSDCDIVIGAHTHNGAYTKVKNGVSGIVGHCVRVGAFKVYDDYADMSGFDDESLGPAVMFVIDPGKPRANRVQVFDDLEAGLLFLQALKSKN